MVYNPKSIPTFQFIRGKDDKHLDLTGFRGCKFCQNSRYLLIYSYMHLVVFDLEDLEGGEPDEQGKQRPKIIDKFELEKDHEKEFKMIVSA